MPDLTITPTPPSENGSHAELSKRTYIPYIVEATCPECGKKVQQDLRKNYLSYPVPNEPTSIYFAHDSDDEGEDYGGEDWHHEWEEKVVVRLTIEPA